MEQQLFLSFLFPAQKYNLFQLLHLCFEKILWYILILLLVEIKFAVKTFFFEKNLEMNVKHTKK